MTTDNQRLSDSLFLCNLCYLRSFISFDTLFRSVPKRSHCDPLPQLTWGLGKSIFLTEEKFFPNWEKISKQGTSFSVSKFAELTLTTDSHY